jgi:hypothetical protein
VNERPDGMPEDQTTPAPTRSAGEPSPERSGEEQGAVEPPATGHADVDASLAALAGTSVEDIDARIRTGEDVHRILRSTLTELGG